MKTSRVYFTKFSAKQARRLPRRIAEAFDIWRLAVEHEGIRATRMLPGYHDEPLKGDRKGQRSVRLSVHYRAIYEESETNELVLITVVEVNNHEY